MLIVSNTIIAYNLAKEVSSKLTLHLLSRLLPTAEANDRRTSASSFVGCIKSSFRRQSRVLLRTVR